MSLQLRHGRTTLRGEVLLASSDTAVFTVVAPAFCRETRRPDFCATLTLSYDMLHRYCAKSAIIKFPCPGSDSPSQRKLGFQGNSDSDHIFASDNSLQTEHSSDDSQQPVTLRYSQLVMCLYIPITAVRRHCISFCSVTMTSTGYPPDTRVRSDVSLSSLDLFAYYYISSVIVMHCCDTCSCYSHPPYAVTRLNMMISAKEM